MMRKAFACLVAVAAIAAANAAHADGLFRTSTGPNGADFSGVSLGANVGAAIGGNGSINTSGLAGGGHLGYNLQNGAIVGGLEADVLVGSITGGEGGLGNFSQNWLTSARIKGGYSFGDVMAYGTAGPSWSTSSFQALGFTANKTLRGYVLGIGAEYAITRSVTINAELRRYNFGSASYYVPTAPRSLTTNTNMLLLGASTHF